jgi:hypothetical protein
MAFRWQEWFDRILKGEETDPRTLSDFPYYSSWQAGPNRFPEFQGLLLPRELVVTIEPNRFFSRGFVQELFYLAESKPKSKPFREQLKKWEDRLEDTIAFHLFKIWVDEDAWQDRKRQEALSHADDEFFKLARIWIKDKDLTEYLTNRVAGLMEWNGEVASKYSKYASEYVERSAWFKARKEKIENMKVQTQQ